MYNVILRQAILPVLDTFNRTQISKALKFLEQSQWWSEEHLLELQKTKLLKILSWTRQNSSFYNEHWKAGGEERRATSVYPELNGLPIVNKEDLRARSRDFPLDSFTGRVLPVQSSGSTGVPMTFFRSGQQESWFWAIRFRMWQWAGYELGDPYLVINLNQRLAWKKKLQDLLFRCCYLSYNANNEDSQHILACLRRRKIVHLNGFSSTLLVLARYMKQNGIENPGVRSITSTGDDLFPDQKKFVEAVFGVGVTDYYGAGGEGVHLASQCEYGSQYHVHMENSIVELIRDGRPARPGETGSVVVTQLDNYPMPLIRYDLGDIATASDNAPCPCGRALQTIESINGRACDIVCTPNGAALLPQFFFIGAFKTLEKVDRYQIIQERLDRINIKLVASPGCDQPKCERALANEVTQATRGSLKVEFDWVHEIPLSGRGKFRPVISRLSSSDRPV